MLNDPQMKKAPACADASFSLEPPSLEVRAEDSTVRRIRQVPLCRDFGCDECPLEQEPDCNKDNCLALHTGFDPVLLSEDDPREFR